MPQGSGSSQETPRETPQEFFNRVTGTGRAQSLTGLGRGRRGATPSRALPARHIGKR